MLAVSLSVTALNSTGDPVDRRPNEMSKKTKVLSVAVSEEKLKEIDSIRLQQPFKPSRSAFAGDFIDDGITRIKESMAQNQSIRSIGSIGGGQSNG
jgi:hypothetical protein